MISSQNPMVLQRHDNMYRTNQKLPHITETSEFLIERIKSNLDDALSVLPEYFYHWQIFNDRRCICDTNSIDSNSLCPFCYGTGFLPGYSKRGFKTEIINYSVPWNTINAITNIGTNQIYPSFQLRDTALKAKLETCWIPLMKNYGLDVIKPICNGNVLIKAISNNKIYDISNKLSEFENDFNSLTKIKFIIELRRNKLDEISPRFSGLKLRYKTKMNPEIKADIPKFNFEQERDQIGILYVLDSYDMYVNSEVASEMKIGDFFEHVRPITIKDNINRKNLKVKFVSSGTRFKLQRTEVLAPQGNVINSDTLVRLIQPDESLMKID